MLRVLCILASLALSIHAQTRSCPTDMYFVLDRSGSIDRDNGADPNNRGRVLNFLKSVIQNININNNNARIGLVSFAANPIINFNIGSQSTFNQYSSAIDQVANFFSGGSTGTAGALSTARTTFSGNRNKLILLVTDGEPTQGINGNLTNEVNLLRSANIDVVGAVVSNKTFVVQSLNGIVNNQRSDSSFDTEFFTGLPNLVAGVAERICPTTQFVPTPDCPAPIAGVAFSVLAAYDGMVNYNEGDRIQFGRVLVNVGNSYDNNNHEFICPCSGIYTFSLTMNHMSSPMGATIMKGPEPISPMGFTDDLGSLSTETIVQCEEGEMVYAMVVLINGVTLVPCSYNEHSLIGFTGKLDFKFQ